MTDLNDGTDQFGNCRHCGRIDSYSAHQEDCPYLAHEFAIEAAKERVVEAAMAYAEAAKQLMSDYSKDIKVIQELGCRMSPSERRILITVDALQALLDKEKR